MRTERESESDRRAILRGVYRRDPAGTQHGPIHAAVSGPLGLRILEAGWDILRPYPEYPGRERWTDRIFYRGASGEPQPLSVIWKDHVPWMLNGATGILQLLATRRLRGAMRLLMTE